MTSSIFKVRAHRRAQSSGRRRGRPALVGSNQEESEAAQGAATAATPATPRGSTPGAIGVDGSYKPIAPNLTACSFGCWLVLVCCKRKVLLAGCWWMVCSERKVLLPGG
jgi:hypothetical protein